MSFPEKKSGLGSVTQDNRLIEACYSMSLGEKRLVLLAASKVDPRRVPGLGGGFEFEISSCEWLERFPCSIPWRSLKKAANDLAGRQMFFHPKTGVIEPVFWVDFAECIASKSLVRLRFSRPVSLLFAGMPGEFTKISLIPVQRLGSFYAIRLYELLSQFRSTGYRRMLVEDFRYAMDCFDRYPCLKELKRRVLLPALAEINEKSDLRVTCTDIKQGRKITAFEFITKA